MKKTFLIIMLAFLFLIALPVSALTQPEIQALIQQLQQQIIELQAQLQTMLSQQGSSTPTTPGSVWCHTFNTNLGFANSGSEEATALHTALQKQNISYGTDGLNVYSEGTANAVKAFQEKYAFDILSPYGLTRGTGYVGKTTRAKLNAIYGCSQAPVACTQEAKQCPNGSYVSRTGPNCEFSSCPTIPPACTPSWYCGSWSTCANSQQTRACTDLNNCGVATNKPSLTQSCSSTCTPNWQCGSWSACSNNNQIRTCADVNSCGITNNKPITTQYCASTCTPEWQCEWSACSNNIQNKVCTDSNNCGTTVNKPIGMRSCSSQTTCAPNWQCGSWSACSNNNQTRACTDLNNCGVATSKPSSTQSCSSQTTCTPNWQCGSWSACSNNNQTRACTDVNSCGTISDKPLESQYCSIGSVYNCQSVSFPGSENFKCVYGLAPYNTGSHIEMNHNALNSLVSSLNSLYLPQKDCGGCIWYGPSIPGNPWAKYSCSASTPTCDFSKVPNTLEWRTFTDYCYNEDVVFSLHGMDVRLAKGETLEQAYQNAIEDQKRMLLGQSEAQCVSEMVDEYYIGGETGSPNWMCQGEKYRLNPNSTYDQWQKWVNGAWTTDFDWDENYTCQ